jgi:putative phosphoesterase
MKIGIISDTHDNLQAIEDSVKIFGDFGELELGDIKIALIHGKDENIVAALAKSSLYDVVIRGHTHKHYVMRTGSTLVINPGEACGYLTNRRTVAILDTENMKVEMIEI